MDNMTISMLHAVSDMIKECEDVKVQCAKIMLDKILDGCSTYREVNPIPKVTLPKRPVHNPVSDDDYLLVTDENGALKEIKQVFIRDEDGNVVDSREIDGTTLLELDGAKVEYKNAKGKKFKRGRVL